MSEPATQLAKLGCEQCRELLSDYADRELTTEEQQSVERHLSTCPRCTTESTRMVGLKKVVRHWDGIHGSDAFHQSVMQKLITESQMMSSRQFTDAAAQARAESRCHTPPPSRSWCWLLVGVLLASAVAIAAYFLARG